MEKLAEKYRPRSLNEVVGQPCLRYLKGFVANPFNCCLLFESPDGGVGKTSAALALAADLGCVDEMSGLLIQPCSELSVERAREIFHGGALHCRPFMGNGWRVIVLEELDWLSQQTQRFLKVALETRLPKRCLVIGTSNDCTRLDKPLLQRFDIYRFQADESFKEACRERIVQIWKVESGMDEMPPGWAFWGDQDDNKFSMRVALKDMQSYLMMLGGGD